MTHKEMRVTKSYLNGIFKKDILENLTMDTFLSLYDGLLSPDSHNTKVVSNLPISEMESLEELGKAMFGENLTLDTKNNFYNHIFGRGETDRQKRDAIIYKTLNIPTPDATRTQMNKNAFALFDRYYTIFPDMELTNLCHYIFMTRPDLNIFNEGGTGIKTDVMTVSNIFNTIYRTNPYLVKSLSSTMDTHEFIPVITSRVESLQLPDYSLRSYTIEQPYSGYTMPISTHGIHSTTGGQFDLTLRETSDLSMHKLFQLWTKYINDINLGRYSPKYQYIVDNRCDYAVSLYDIICAPDAKTILYWVKYVGAFPNIVPISDISFNKGGVTSNQVTITFDYFLSEQMEIYSLIDFNLNAGVIDSPNTIIKTLSGTHDGIIEDNITIDADRTSASQNPFSIPIYGTGEALYAYPYIKFNWGEAEASKQFPTLEWVKYK